MIGAKKNLIRFYCNNEKKRKNKVMTKKNVPKPNFEQTKGIGGLYLYLYSLDT
jgi:hypothetical protein